MVTSQAPRAWLLLAAGEDRGHAGNEGYDDQYDAYYSWDSNVPNHKKLRVGDPIALWDKRHLLGISVIEEIETSRGHKLLNRCPNCKTTRISARKTVRPRFRCMRCRHEFQAPQSNVVDVDLYRARYDAAWVQLEGLLGEGELRSLAIHAGDINAMRPISWIGLQQALADKDAERAAERVAMRMDIHWSSESLSIPQGFGAALVRVRKGQAQFRQHLLDSQGSVCAFTGGAPLRALEAGHLYSYAEIGSHFEHGGLMLRRDIHRLFDDGQLAINPSSLRVDVSSDLSGFPQYKQLHDAKPAVRFVDKQVDWLRYHWAEHRGIA